MKTIYLVCYSFVVFDAFGKRVEDGEVIKCAYLDKSKAIQKINDLNKSIEIEEGDSPYYINYLSVEE